jgi:hypothetical protein
MQRDGDLRAGCVMECERDEVSREPWLLDLREAVRVDAQAAARPGEEGEGERAQAEDSDPGQRPWPYAPPLLVLGDE